ncbi:transforming acidic coiled-coil-containing protein [Chryseobacterium oryctis]|uniref:Transforming acidic coiled-coil-containing protein n=1 Tax=Chryseobacterium oryctis TaxID=2952618 RepID=A0ABT3HJ15_9FLAO|nr:transforming acidic coiled-coil-containing protein [Chryseobacterium oryctis]MCW3159688.1 transforming acidic coiled-coil-containing protein [Chryseobacterium oryctis]
METAFQNQTHEKKGNFLFILAGKENTSTSISERRRITLIAYLSLFATIFHTTIITAFIQLTIEIPLVSVISGFFTVFIIPMFNRFSFLYATRSTHNNWLVILLYVLIYASLSFLLPVLFVSLQHGYFHYDIGEIFSPISVLAFCAGFIVSQLPLLVNYMFVRNYINVFELENDELREELKQKILEVKRRYLELCSPVSNTESETVQDDPFAPLNTLSQDEKLIHEQKLQAVKHELNLLETALAELF